MHLLQSPHWGLFKSQFGWTACQLIVDPTCPLADEIPPVQVLFRDLPLGFQLAYVPKGPDLDWFDLPSAKAVLQTLCRFAKRRQTIFLKVEPDAPDHAAVAHLFHEQGFVSAQPIQPSNTIVLNIAPDEATILQGMKAKTRYNIRLAAKKGVTVRHGTLADVPIFHRLSQETGERNSFGVHSLAYYQAVFQQFPPENRVLLLAEYLERPLAALMIFAWDGRAYYLYGASSNQHRNRMPTYLLQWEAIKWAKAQGSHSYDLWGIPDVPRAQLEAEFQQRHEGLWGVYRAKRGFGGEVVRSVRAFDYVYQPFLYKLWLKYLDKRSE